MHLKMHSIVRTSDQRSDCQSGRCGQCSERSVVSHIPSISWISVFVEPKIVTRFAILFLISKFVLILKQMRTKWPIVAFSHCSYIAVSTKLHVYCTALHSRCMWSALSSTGTTGTGLVVPWVGSSWVGLKPWLFHSVCICLAVAGSQALVCSDVQTVSTESADL